MKTQEPASILILGGTSEAREIARELTSQGRTVVLSFAGRTSPQHLPSVETRIGGFGGVPGLVAELQKRPYALLIDATNPFSTQMAQNAAAAAELAAIPYLRLLRPPWRPLPGSCWHEVDDLEQAAALLGELEVQRAFLSLGSGQTGAFARVNNVELVLRSIEPPASTPEHAMVILARGPFTVEAELALFRDQQIDVLVTRNSGGHATQAKLEAARRLGIPVIMIQRPEQPTGPRASTVGEVLRWVEGSLATSG